MIVFEDVQKHIEGKNYTTALDMICAQDIMHLDAAAICQTEKCLKLIPEGAVTASPHACLVALCVDLHYDRFIEARKWYARLALLRDGYKDGSKERDIASQYLCCAGLMLPNTDNAHMLLLFAILFNEYGGRNKMPSPMPLSATLGRPSVLRGAKDLSEWGKNYRAVASIVEPMLTVLLNDKKHGISSAAVAELLYEYNSLNAAAEEVASALSSNITEVVFAGMALLMRINFASATDEKRITELFVNMKRLIDETSSTQLLPAYNALRTKLDIHVGRLEPVAAWLETCEEDELHCTHANSYELMTKAEAMIALGRPRDAITLLECLQITLREDFYPLDTIECLAHCAVACELLNDRERALDKLKEALQIAEPYKYIRVIADRGAVMLRLLSQACKESTFTEDISEKYLHKVLETTQSYAMLRPALYTRVEKSEQSCELTAMEIQILHLLMEGKPNKEISDMLNIKLPTVKFHLANLFEKLQVQNRTAAVNAAKNLNLL
ncbi:MAG: LuxR C-terminal-related transcriptional regulator [Oscillospiraceae bacterium]